MWRPPNARKVSLPVVQWPTPEEAQRSLCYTAVQVGPMTLEQRTWVPAMVPWRATDEGFVTPDVIDWYVRMAKGRPGAIVVEATGVRDIPSGPLLRIGDDRFIEGLSQLVAAVRAASDGHTRLLIQLIDFLAIRRRPAPDKFFARFLAITDRHRTLLADVARTDAEIRAHLSAAPESELERVLTERELESLRFGHRERVTDVEFEHIRDLPRVLPGIFAAAARRAVQAGFDGVELHYAHAYTMASFLSARNTRDDGYGGDLAGRMRLPLEVYRAVRACVPESFAVGCRFLADECIAGGSTVNDAVHFGVAFARAGMDFVSLSRGGKFEDAKQPKEGWAAYPYTGPSGYECMPTVYSDAQGPFLRNVAGTSSVRQAIRGAGMTTPVVVAGGIGTFEQAEGILQRGEADIIGSARQTLADPDWFRKVALGRGTEIRRCEFTNYCEALDQTHKQVTCKLWDRQQLDEPGVARSSDGRRRLVAPRWEP